MNIQAHIKIDWPDHWTNGGTGITRCTTTGEAIAESVKQFGDSKIWMEDENRELHSALNDLSKFWNFHRNRIGESHP